VLLLGNLRGSRNPTVLHLLLLFVIASFRIALFVVLYWFSSAFTEHMFRTVLIVPFLLDGLLFVALFYSMIGVYDVNQSLNGLRVVGHTIVWAVVIMWPINALIYVLATNIAFAAWIVNIGGYLVMFAATVCVGLHQLWLGSVNARVHVAWALVTLVDALFLATVSIVAYELYDSTDLFAFDWTRISHATFALELTFLACAFVLLPLLSNVTARPVVARLSPTANRARSNTAESPHSPAVLYNPEYVSDPSGTPRIHSGDTEIEISPREVAHMRTYIEGDDIDERLNTYAQTT
jgi:hypothetical protein